MAKAMTGGRHQFPPPSIQCDGKLVTIFYNQLQLNEPEQCSSFHALWLWHNDPSNIYPTSGQRKQSLSSYYSGAVIAQAKVIHMSDLGPSDQSTYRPKLGSTNPIMTFSYGHGLHEVDSAVGEMSNFLVLIHWRDPKQSSSSSEGGFLSEKKDGGDYGFCHTSIFNMQWLHQWSYASQALQAARLKREVSRVHTFRHKQKAGNDAKLREQYDGLLSVDYCAILSKEEENQQQLLYFMDAVFNDGAVIVNNAPDIKTESLHDTVISNVGEALGDYISHGNLYGDTFQVKSVPNANNVAFTSEPLCPHQDLAYYESKPGFQLLYCVSMPSNIVGGESILIDCMAAAHTLRDLAPDLFEILVKCPATFVKYRKGAHMTYSRPHIVLQQGGEQDLNDMGREIVSVHWSPPFEGPLNIHFDQVAQYYKAYAAFELMLDDSKCPLAYSENFDIEFGLASKLSDYAKENTWHRRLAPGEIMVFNNNRFLHGRRGSSVDPGSCEVRHLIGAYTDIDDTLNKYRVLLDKMGQTRVIPNVGNSTISVLP